MPPRRALRQRRVSLTVFFALLCSFVVPSLAGGPPGTPLSRARELLGQYRLEEADAVLAPLLESSPASDEALVLAGRIQEEMGDTAAARRNYEAAVAGNARNGDARCYLARVLLGLKDYKGAAQHLRAALKLVPGSALPLSMGAIYYLQKGNQKLGLKYAEKALAVDPTAKEALLALADLKFLERDLDGAHRAIDRLFAARPDDPDGLYLKGIVLFNQKDFAGAQRALEQASRIQPYAANFQKDLAQVYAQNGLLKRAIVTLDRVLALTPGDEAALSLRSNLVERQSLLDSGVRRTEGPFVFIHAPGLAEATFQNILQLFQAAYAEVCRDTGYHPPKVRVWIFEKTGSLLPAFYSHVSDEIIISSAYYASIDSLEKKRLGRHLIFHEFSHLVLFQALGRPAFSPRALWLMEGLAEKQAGGYDYTAIDYQRTFEPGLLDFGELADYLPVSAVGAGEKREKAYIQAYLMVDFLLRQPGGFARIRQMIQAYAAGKSDHDVFETHVQVSPSDFLQQVGEFIRGSFID